MKYIIETKAENFGNLSRQQADRIINRLLNEGIQFTVSLVG